MSVTRSRSFCFTWNNYPDDHADVVERLGTRYHCYGYETCPTTGTEHLQGFVYFDMPKSFTAVRRGLLGSHVSIAKGSVAQNITYCSKEDCFLEFGERPMSQELKGSNEQKRWASAYECAQKGLISEIPGDIAIRCYANIKRIESDFMAIVPNSREPCGVWIHGESGAGKSYSVHFRYPGLYNKMRNKWWDGYQNEEVVLIDDMDIYDIKLGGQLKHWADAYSFMAERKGSATRCCPKKVIVTSQYTISEIWSDPKTIDALTRRFTVIEKILGQDIVI